MISRVWLVVALVAFGTGFPLLGAHMTVEALLLELELTWLVYGIGLAGAVGAVLALRARKAEGSSPDASSSTSAKGPIVALTLNVLLIGLAWVSTNILVMLPPVTFALNPGDDLPEFTQPLRTREGKDVSAAALRGRPTLLLFHRGGWCPFCQSELARLVEYEDELAALARVIAVSVDAPDAVALFAAARGFSFELAHDDGGAVARQLGLTFEDPEKGIVPAPAAIVIDAKGRVSWFHVASDVRDRADPDELLEHLRALP